MACRSAVFSSGVSSVAFVVLALAALDGCGQTGSDERLGTAQSALTGFAVTTRAYGSSRFGANTTETALAPANVNIAGFAKLFTITLDDSVYAQPLYASGMSIAGGTHNVVFTASVNNTISAFDADLAGAGA